MTFNISEYPIYKQSKDLCGPANLRSFLKYKTGIDYGENFLSFLTKTGKEGCSPEGLIEASGRLGFHSLYVSEGGTIHMLEEMTSRDFLPFVCYTDSLYEEEHWATVFKVNSSVMIADTYINEKRKIPSEEFYRAWTLNENGIFFNNTIVFSGEKSDLISLASGLNSGTKSSIIQKV